MALLAQLGLVLALTALLLLAVALAREPYRLVRAAFALQRWRAGCRRRSLRIGGWRWVYAERPGQDPAAPPLVLLHGFTGGKENWYPLLRALGRRHRVLVPDLPGWGESERRRGEDYGYAAQAARVAEFLAWLSPEQPVVLLGHSMGGAIAALVAARAPQRVAMLGLLNAAGVRFADNAFGRAVLAGANPFAVEDGASLRRYLDTVFHDRRARPWIPWPASAAYIARRRADADFEQAVLDAIGRGPEALLPGEEAAAIRQPVLLLGCRADAVIDPSALAAYAARLPQARQVLLEDCGHMSLMERPRAVAAAILDWMAAAAPPRRTA